MALRSCRRARTQGATAAWMRPGSSRPYPYPLYQRCGLASTGLAALRTAAASSASPSTTSSRTRPSPHPPRGPALTCSAAVRRTAAGLRGRSREHAHRHQSRLQLTVPQRPCQPAAAPPSTSPSTSPPLVHQLGVPTVAGRGAAIRQHVQDMPAPVVADALGYHHVTTTKLAAQAGTT
jgi:hypothetical protein